MILTGFLKFWCLEGVSFFTVCHALICFKCRKVPLIPSLAKVFASVLENRLSFKNLVCRDDDPLQRGFKKDCMTSDNLFVLYNLIETEKNT